MRKASLFFWIVGLASWYGFLPTVCITWAAGIESWWRRLTDKIGEK